MKKYTVFFLILYMCFVSHAMDIPIKGIASSGARRRSLDLAASLMGTTPPNELSGISEKHHQDGGRERSGSFDLQREDEDFSVSFSESASQLVEASKIFCTMKTDNGNQIFGGLVAVEKMGRSFNGLSPAVRDSILTALRRGRFETLSEENKKRCLDLRLIIKSETGDEVTSPFFTLLDGFGCIQHYQCTSVNQWGKVDWSTNKEGDVTSITLFPPPNRFFKRLTPFPMDHENSFEMSKSGDSL